MGKQVGGLMYFLSNYYQEKLREIMKYHGIENEREAIMYCIGQVWFDQIGQYKDEDVVGK